MKRSRPTSPARSARFQASIGPTAMAMTSGVIRGRKVRLKKGGPTEIFSPVSPSSASGYSVPNSTTPRMVESSRLFATSAPSRLTASNCRPARTVPMRKPKNSRAPPM